MIRPSLHPLRLGWLVVCGLLAITVSGQAFAQTQVTGTVTVPAGASLEGTQVTVYDPATGKSFRGPVDATGKFTIMVEPGTYSVAVIGRGFAQQFFQNVAVAQDQTVTQDVTLAAAKPSCIVKAAAPIALTEDINSAAFADAPDIPINAGWNIVEGFENVANWRGPATVGGRARMKYSTEGLHIAADITFAKPNTNFGSDTELWKGNSLEILLQDDPYNATRSALDPMHNFRVVVALTDPPRWRFGNDLTQTPQVNGQNADIATYVSVKNRTDNMGNLVRVNIPWAFFTTGDPATPIAVPADSALLAMDLRINNTTPEATDTASAGRQFQLAASGFGGTDPRGLIPVQLCPTAP